MPVLFCQNLHSLKLRYNKNAYLQIIFKHWTAHKMLFIIKLTNIFGGIALKKIFLFLGLAAALGLSACGGTQGTTQAGSNPLLSKTLHIKQHLT